MVFSNNHPDSSLPDTSALLTSSSRLPLAAPEWKFRADMNEPRSSFAAVALDAHHRVMVTGGCDGALQCLATVSVYDQRTDQWSSPAAWPNLRQGRWGHVAAACQEKVYVMGGWDAQDSPLDSIECLDTTQEEPQWVTLPVRLSKQRFGSTAAVVGDKVYVMGGFDESSVEILDTVRHQILPGPPLTTVRYGAGASVVGATVWIVGGYDADQVKLKTAECLQGGDDAPAWALCPATMDQGRFGPAVTAVGQHLVVMGSGDRDEFLSSVEVLNTARGMWWRLPDMLVPRFCGASVTLGGTVLVMGGASDDVTHSSVEALELWSMEDGILCATKHGKKNGDEMGTQVETAVPMEPTWSSPEAQAGTDRQTWCSTRRVDLWTFGALIIFICVWSMRLFYDNVRRDVPTLDVVVAKTCRAVFSDMPEFMGDDTEGFGHPHLRTSNNRKSDWAWAASLSIEGTALALRGLSTRSGAERETYERMYRLEDCDWTEIDVGQRLIDDPGDGLSGSMSVSIADDGAVLAVGHPEHNGDQDAGLSRTYRVESCACTATPSQGAQRVAGRTVARSGDGHILAVGLSMNKDAQSEAEEHVSVYHLGEKNWTKIGNDVYGQDAGDDFGRSIALSRDGTVLAVGAPKNDNNGEDAGQVRVYRLGENGNWNQVGRQIDGKTAKTNFGSTVAISSDGRIISVGAQKNGDTDASLMYYYDDKSGHWKETLEAAVGV